MHTGIYFQDLQCQLEVSRTRLTALQKMNKSEKEDILKQVEVLTCVLASFPDVHCLQFLITCSSKQETR